MVRTHNPQYWHTGIKTDYNGREKFKCHYACECGYKGRHYIPLFAEYVMCHDCGYHIQVEPAGRLRRNGVPRRDRWGNYFIAIAAKYI